MRINRWNYRKVWYIYIPLWFYSNCIRKYRISCEHIYLHSTMVLFKWTINEDLQLENIIYIPLWFYSNIFCCCWYCFICLIYIPLWFYSNWDMERLQLYKNVFTFHYGSIQIIIHCKKQIFMLIYIPLWFYSNSTETIQIQSFWSIYIPLWFYSNVWRNNNDRRKSLDLHSTMVLFKLIGVISGVIGYYDLHSTMVLFKFGYHFLYCSTPTAFTFHYGSIQIWICTYRLRF